MADIKIRSPLPAYDDPTNHPLLTLTDQSDGTFALKISGTVGTAAGGGAPSDATYITKTANANLSAEVAIGAGTAGQILQSDGTNPVYTSMGTTAAAVGTSAGGSATTASKSDHVHATGAGTPTTSAVGDAAATGTGPAAAMTNHVHGREAFGASAAAVGTSAAGAATTPSRSDHVHATGAGTPSTQAMGDTAATGTGPAAAMTDHKHAMPALGTSAAAIGTSAGGSAVTPSKSDHVHATGAGTPSTQAFGDAAAIGTGPAAAMTDHKHAMPVMSISENAITADVAMTSINTFYDGASLTLAAGTYVLWGKGLLHTASAGTFCNGKLWDGTTVYDSIEGYLATSGGNISLGMFATVVLGGSTTLKVSFAQNSASGTLKAAPETNNTGETKATHLMALRIS